MYTNNPVAIRLRELQTLVEVAKEKNMVLIADTTRSDLSNLGFQIAAAMLGKGQQGTSK